MRASEQIVITGRSAAGGGGFTTSCPVSAAYLARTSGLDDGHKAIYDAFICGLESDGIGSAALDALWILCAQNSATSLLNVYSASFTIVPSGAGWAFLANQGYAGDGSNFGNTGLAPSAAVRFTQLNGSIGACTITNRTTPSATETLLGSNSGANATSILPLAAASTANFSVNQASPDTGTSTSALGFWLASRTSNSVITLYRNGTQVGSGADTSAAPSSQPFYISALNNSGAAQALGTDRITLAFVGRGLAPSEATAFAARVTTFMTALGLSI